MDKTTLLVAIIPSAIAFLGIVVTGIVTLKTNKKTLEANHDATINELQNTNSLITMRMDSMSNEIKSLRTKVESHNQYDRRIVALETKGDMMERILEKLTDDGK